jgi:hypothetical protein
VQPVAADLADTNAIVKLIDAHRAAYGRMDVLVNAAADGNGRGTLAEVDPEVVERHLNVNLCSLFTTLQQSLEMLEAAGAEHGKALVVNVGSAAAKSGAPGLSFYAAAKGWGGRHDPDRSDGAPPGRHPVHDDHPRLHRHANGTLARTRRHLPRRAGAARRPGGGAAVPAAHLADLPRPEIEFNPPGQGEIIQRLVALRAQQPAEAS